jgi:hypothetical protein
VSDRASNNLCLSSRADSLIIRDCRPVLAKESVCSDLVRHVELLEAWLLLWAAAIRPHFDFVYLDLGVLHRHKESEHHVPTEALGLGDLVRVHGFSSVVYKEHETRLLFDRSHRRIRSGNTLMAC